MKILLILIMTLLLVSSCFTNLPRNPERQLEWAEGACLPNAINMKHGLRNSTKWSKILIYEYTELDTGAKMAHAVCMYIYPAGSNQLWAYDSEGSTRIRAHINDPIGMARLTEITRNRIKNNVTSAYFLDDAQD